jgi:chromosome segregation protein
VIITLEGQLQALKKQARQATRYRNICDQIRRAEAIVIHLQWREAEAAIEATRAHLRAAESAIGERMAATTAATTAEAAAAEVLPELRHAEAAAAAELQRLRIAADALEREAERNARASEETAARLAQIERDRTREEAQAAEAGSQHARLAGERDALAGQAAGEAAAIAEALARVAEAEAAIETLDGALAGLTQQIAAGEARQGELDRQIADLGTRLERQKQREREISAESQRLTAARDADQSLKLTDAALAEAESVLERARAEAAIAEETRAAAGTAEAATRNSLQAAQGRQQQVTAERAALRALILEDPSGSLAILDSITVAPGYETALGAALGEDLAAPGDEAAPIHWRAIVDEPGPALPDGAEPLIDRVTNSGRLARRLRQIGVVRDSATGIRAAAHLAQGQRLVSRDGALWRWDGFTIGAGTPTSAAIRLQQRNRLIELEDMLPRLEAETLAAEQRFAEAHRLGEEAARADRLARESVLAAFRAAGEARGAAAKASEQMAATGARLASLAETAAQLAQDIAETTARRSAAASARSELADLGQARQELGLKRGEMAALRAQLAERRSHHDRLRREVEERGRRLLAIADEMRAWAQRATSAEAQIAELEQRRTQSAEELERLSRMPAEIDARRQALLDLTASAEASRKSTADSLAAGEARSAEASRTLKREEHLLAEAREDRVRAEGAVAQAEFMASGLVERARERLDAAPADALQLAEVDPGQDLPERTQLEARLDKLTRERDAMGPVNLRAESEAAELDQQIAGLQSERGDLVAAIARLRQGIASLNREGRERLLAAFEQVNTHFQSLFVRLFGGGRAHLALTEAEDPLDAGLEIMASPPGKRLQVLSLLSGGEQALTALALLFAVFLTNPAPICVLDEVDAPLDDANVDRFCSLVEEIAESSATRFLIITHHRLTMARMDRLFGVTMAERGVSQLVSVDLQSAEQMRVTA